MTGDLNGDGLTDLVHLVNADYVHPWFSNGNGTFSVGFFRPWSGYGIQSGTWVTGDLNGDGRTDLVHLVNSDYIHPWLSNGDGSFSVGYDQAWPGYAVQGGRWVTGDLNGDGRTDLVHLVNSDYIHPWLSNGDGTFTTAFFKPWINYGIANGRWVTGDLDADGRLDMVHLVTSDYVHPWFSNY